MAEMIDRIRVALFTVAAVATVGSVLAQSHVKLGLERSSDLLEWERIPLTPEMIDASGEVILPTTNSEEFFRLRARAFVSPSITAGPADAILQSGQSAILVVECVGTDLVYEWFRGPVGVTAYPVGDGSATFSTPPLETTTTYWVRISNSLGSVDSPSATVTVLGSVDRPSIATIAVMGDSLSGGVAGGESGDRIQGGYIWPLLSDSAGSLDLVRSGTGTNFQTGGFSAQQILETWVPQVLAAQPDACVILAGANSLDDARQYSADLDEAAAWLFGQIQQMIVALRTQGIQVVVCTLTPDAFPTDSTYPPAGGHYHPDFRTIRAKTNELLRENVEGLDASLCDWAGQISTDPNDDTALANPAFLTDSIHFNYVGSWKLGAFLSGIMRSEFTLGAETLPPAPLAAEWVSSNPFAAGNNGGLSDGWITGASGSPLPTVVATKTPEGWQRLVCADGPEPGVNRQFWITSYEQTIDSSYDNRRFAGVFEIWAHDEDWEIWNLEARVVCSNLDTGATTRSFVPVQLASSELPKCLALGPHSDRFVLRTAPVVHPGGAGQERRRIQVQLKIFGRGTVDVRAMGAVEVSP